MVFTSPLIDQYCCLPDTVQVKLPFLFYVCGKVLLSSQHSTTFPLHTDESGRKCCCCLTFRVPWSTLVCQHNFWTEKKSIITDDRKKACLIDSKHKCTHLFVDCIIVTCTSTFNSISMHTLYTLYVHRLCGYATLGFEESLVHCVQGTSSIDTSSLPLSPLSLYAKHKKDVCTRVCVCILCIEEISSTANICTGIFGKKKFWKPTMFVKISYIRI